MFYEVLHKHDEGVRCHPAARIAGTNAPWRPVTDEMILKMDPRENEHWRYCLTNGIDSAAQGH